MTLARLLLIPAILLGSCLAHGADNNDDQAVIDRLKAIENEIRARAAEADAEVARAHAEARRITEEGNARAKKIRDEADEYVRKVEQHIQEIVSHMPGHAPASLKSPAAPTRESLAKTLAADVDPLLRCWGLVETESCVLEKIRVSLAAHLPDKACKVECGK